MQINDTVRVLDSASHDGHIGQEGTVVAVVPYAEVPELTPADGSAATAFVAVQLPNPGFEPATDDDLFMAEVLSGIPRTLTNIIREHRTAVLFDDDMLELVNA